MAEGASEKLTLRRCKTCGKWLPEDTACHGDWGEEVPVVPASTLTELRLWAEEQAEKNRVAAIDTDRSWWANRLAGRRDALVMVCDRIDELLRMEEGEG